MRSRADILVMDEPTAADGHYAHLFSLQAQGYR